MPITKNKFVIFVNVLATVLVSNNSNAVPFLPFFQTPSVESSGSFNIAVAICEFLHIA